MFSSRTNRSLLLVLTIAIFTLSAGSAAASVAYIDGNEVWVSSDDGARKVRLSAGEGDWREVAQSDQGFILGTRKEAGKISQLASFTVWDPTGKVVRFGSLSGAFTGGLNIYPNGIDITPGGTNIVYGFSASNFDFSSAGKGTYMKLTADATTAVPTTLYGAEYPTLVGSRVVAAVGERYTALQDPSSIASDSFTNWIDSGVALAGSPFLGLSLTRSDVAATGTLVASEFRDSTFYTQKIGVSKWAGLGSDGYVDDCVLPASGLPSKPSFSQDGTQLTWQDSRGVVIAGTPNLRLGGPVNCEMPAARVISATGAYPSYGPFNVPATAAPGTTAAKPKVTVGKSIKLDSLKSGLKISVTSAVAGKAKVVLTIKPSKVGKKGKKLITLASGSAKVAAGKKTKIKIKFTSAGKKLKKKLKGKKATLTVTVGKQSTSKSVKLK